jgi:tRNA 2-selenouridine synthase
MAISISVDEFLNQAKKSILIIDVRSPKEYKQGHVLGAINIPLLEDESRVIVGTTFKQEGKNKAVLKGFELEGKNFSTKIETLLKIQEYGKIVLYCWRGGLRSNIMSWLFDKAGFEVSILKGGYKSFRNRCIDTFHFNYKMTVLGGHTGSGKTKILHQLKENNFQVIDLEGIANHKGSAYGGLGMKPQPTQEQFENNLAMELFCVDSKKTIWLEAESIMIGKNQIPTVFFEQMKQARFINLTVDKEQRIKNIIEEYSGFEIDLLIESTKKIEKKLGGLALKNSIEALCNKDFHQWINYLLVYYDKAYLKGLENRKEEDVTNYTLINYNINEFIDFAKNKIPN